MRCLLRASALLLFLLEAAALFAAPPAKLDSLTKPGIFPPIHDASPSPPAPKPLPGSVPVLSGDVIYVIPSDEPFLLFASPPGLVTVTRETGPIRIRAKFLDGSGKVETRTFAAKNVAIVEASGKGRVELIAVPVGAMDESGAARMLIDANNGAQPPPDDKKEPAPEPKPKPPDVDPQPNPQPVVKGPFFLVTVSETMQRTPAEAKIINDTAYWSGLRASGHEYRHYDPQDTNAIKGGYAKVFGELGSCLVIVTKGGTVVKKVPLPKSTTDITAILKELEGAK